MFAIDFERAYVYEQILKNTVWNRWLQQYICCLQQNIRHPMAKKLQELYSEAAFLQVQYMNDQTHRVNQRRRGWLPRLKEIRTRKGNNYTVIFREL